MWCGWLWNKCSDLHVLATAIGPTWVRLAERVCVSEGFKGVVPIWGTNIPAGSICIYIFASPDHHRRVFEYSLLLSRWLIKWLFIASDYPAHSATQNVRCAEEIWIQISEKRESSGQNEKNRFFLNARIIIINGQRCALFYSVSVVCVDPAPYHHCRHHQWHRKFVPHY